jgi:hypothetical protein
MKGEPMETPPPDLLAWLSHERSLVEVPAAMRERIYLRIRRTLGFGGSGGPGPAGGAGLSGMMLGGLLAVLLAGGTATFVAVHAWMAREVGTDRTARSASEADALGVPVARSSSPERPGGLAVPPRWSPGVAGGALDSSATGPARASAGSNSGSDQERPELPGWVGQRNVERQRIAGTVLDRGRPAAGVEVLLEGIASAADPRFAQRAVTGADGRFGFGPQPAWHYVVSASSRGRKPAAVRIRLGDPTLRPAPDALILELSDCSARVWGVITDQSGRGVPDVRVRRTADAFNGPAVETDASGRYEICAEPGPVRLRVEGDGYGVVFVATTAGPGTRTDIQLNTEAVAQGTTVTLEGVPIPHVQLNLAPGGRGPRSANPAAPISTISDDRGHFEARGLAPGRYWMNAWSAQYMGRERATFEVQAGEIKRGLVRRLHPTSQVEAIVMSSGRPVAGAAISMAIRGTEDDSSFGAVTQADGRVTLHGVFHGDNEFRVRGFRVISPMSVQIQSSPLADVLVEVEREQPAPRALP